MLQPRNTLSPIAQQKQPERQAEDIYNETEFEKAFNAATEEMLQSEESDLLLDSRLDARPHDIPDGETRRRLDTSHIDSFRILDDDQKMEEEGKETGDEEELARTAAELLEKVKGEDSRKFRDSNFLSLMRQFRDKDVRIVDNNLVDVSNPSPNT